MSVVVRRSGSPSPSTSENATGFNGCMMGAANAPPPRESEIVQQLAAFGAGVVTASANPSPLTSTVNAWRVEYPGNAMGMAGAAPRLTTWGNVPLPAFTNTSALALSWISTSGLESPVRSATPTRLLTSVAVVRTTGDTSDHVPGPMP